MVITNFIDPSQTMSMLRIAQTQACCFICTAVATINIQKLSSHSICSVQLKTSDIRIPNEKLYKRKPLRVQLLRHSFQSLCTLKLLEIKSPQRCHHFLHFGCSKHHFNCVTFEGALQRKQAKNFCTCVEFLIDIIFKPKILLIFFSFLWQ